MTMNCKAALFALLLCQTVWAAGPRDVGGSLFMEEGAIAAIGDGTITLHRVLKGKALETKVAVPAAMSADLAIGMTVTVRYEDKDRTRILAVVPMVKRAHPSPGKAEGPKTSGRASKPGSAPATPKGVQ